MRTVGVRQLRQNLSKYLREVREGESFRVTDRGRSVAALGPLPEEADSLDRLIARGIARPPSLDFSEIGPPPKSSSGESLSEILADMRKED